MRTVGLAAVVPYTDLQLGLTSGSHSHDGTPLHQQWLSTTSLGRRHRGRPMAGSFTSIHQLKKSLLIPEVDAIYRTRPARARWGKSDRSVTCPGESLLGGVAPVGTCRGSHWEVRRRATARRSPYNCFSLGWRRWVLVGGR